MVRTMTSFALALEMEKAECKPFRNALDKSDRKKYDEILFDIPRLYIYDYTSYTQLLGLSPFLISILLHCFTQLGRYISQVNELMVVGSNPTRSISSYYGTTVLF